MFPILFSLGPLSISSIAIFLLLAWAIFSFSFWRSLRASAIQEDRIFDLTFYSTLILLVCARLGFVVTHWDLFADSFLKIAALWVTPGFSWYAGLAGAIVTLIYLSRSYKVRVGLVLDALAVSLPLATVVGKIGSFLDGAEIGRIAALPWALSYPGYEGLRHPVQLYEIIALLLIGGIMSLLQRRAVLRKWPYGLLGVVFFLLFTPVMFTLELVKESSVYWVITANQWILIGFFAESLGALYVRGGGREAMRVKTRRMMHGIHVKGSSIYAAISKRGAKRDQTSS